MRTIWKVGIRTPEGKLIWEYSETYRSQKSVLPAVAKINRQLKQTGSSNESVAIKHLTVLGG